MMIELFTTLGIKGNIPVRNGTTSSLEKKLQEISAQLDKLTKENESLMREIQRHKQMDEIVQKSEKRLTEALQDSEERYRMLIENILTVVWTSDELVPLAFDFKYEEILSLIRKAKQMK